MNNLFLSGLPPYSTNVTGSFTIFKQATFYSCSGFSVSGLPIFNTGKLFVGAASGFNQYAIQPPSGGVPVVIISNSTISGFDTLSSYFVTPEKAGDGCYIAYN